MLPPRYWPTGAWVVVIAVGILILHGVGLAVHLAIVGPSAQSYADHVIASVTMGLVILGLGTGVAISIARQGDDQVAGLGRAMLLTLLVIALGLLLLGLPILWPDS